MESENAFAEAVGTKLRQSHSRIAGGAGMVIGLIFLHPSM